MVRNYLKSVFMYKILNNHTAPNLRTSFRLNNECDNTSLIPMILEIEKPICLFLNRIPTLVKDFKYNGAVVWNNLPYEVKVAESLSSFQRTITVKPKQSL